MSSKATVVNLQNKRDKDKEIIHNSDIIQLKFISCNIPLLQDFLSCFTPMAYVSYT